MRRFFRWLVGAPIAIIVIAFAVANRRWVTLSLDPFSQDAPFAAIDMPLWLLLFVGVFIGILVGWFGAWIAQGKWRRAARESKAEVALLQKELADLRKTDAGYSRQEITTTGTFPGGLM